jgi:hypothetical protein
MQDCLILAARRYDFKDEDGRRIEGVTLTYLTGDIDREADRVGQASLSIPAPVAVWHQLQAVPGFYQVDFRQRPGKGGRPALQAVGLEYIAPVTLQAPPVSALAE